VTDIAYRRLGNSGLAVSVVGIGCNNFGGRMEPGQVDEVVHAALDLGVNFFDTADNYGAPGRWSEELLGAALGSRRDEVFIATKFGGEPRGQFGRDYNARASRWYIARDVEQSLRRLRTDHIDLYQLHVPDPLTPIEETLAALDDLVHAGKVRYLGCSNFAGWQVADAAWAARTGHRTPFVSVQNRYSLLSREVEREVVPACLKFGLGLLPYFPLERGLLTGKYHRGADAPAGTRLARPEFARRLAAAQWDRIEALSAYAADRGLTLLDVAIGGLAAMPAVSSVIAGATSAEQVRANVAAAAWQPTEEDVHTLFAVSAGPVT
jgi:aryl-alcohol dehydrogenase-like predicted oxidoreductase